MKPRYCANDSSHCFIPSLSPLSAEEPVTATVVLADLTINVELLGGDSAAHPVLALVNAKWPSDATDAFKSRRVLAICCRTVITHTWIKGEDTCGAAHVEGEMTGLDLRLKSSQLINWGTTNTMIRATARIFTILPDRKIQPKACDMRVRDGQRNPEQTSALHSAELGAFTNAGNVEAINSPGS
ncbi:hypothetical protein BD779DRAFT_1787678 [Infundibulicybe gibba]|nr:hypothetical protein BD779DRAFT_1787678 [Infundibulicybe gibba]